MKMRQSFVFCIIITLDFTKLKKILALCIVNLEEKLCVRVHTGFDFCVHCMQLSTLKFATRMMCVPNEPLKSTQHDPYVS